MPKASILIFFAVTLSLTAASQNQYRYLREKYNTDEYEYRPGDPNRPALNGLASFLIPGLGQALAREPMRGLGFATAFYGGATVMILPLTEGLQIAEQYKFLMFFGGMTVTFGAWVWAIVDAPEVARVKNMAYRDRPKIGARVGIQPIIYSNADNKLTGGVGITIRF
jgi:hypothetical protein